ncbi:MAG: DUF4363 family protein [Clostridia bacterium]|nr:DUF4363 family protein [Clostridia bacterium]
MKRVVIAFLLFLSAVSVSAWSNISFEKNMKEFSRLIDNLIVYSEKVDDKTLENETRKVVDAWYGSSAFLHSLVAHEGMDELERSITSLPLLIEHSDREEFRNECIKAVNQIDNLIDSEKLDIGNILVIPQVLR